jgi:uncharacterized oxidoreductase
LVTSGRDPGRLAELSLELPDVDVVAADLTRPEDIDRLIRIVNDRHGKLDVLVNNAGVSWNLDLTDPTRESRDAANMIATNLTAPVQLTLKALPLLSLSSQGAIVNVTSIQAVVTKGRSPVYAATKAGLRAFTVALRKRLADTNIQVFDLMPPLTDTPAAEKIPKKKMDPAELAEAAIAAIEAGRLDIRVGQNRWVVQLHRIAPRLAQRVIK